MYKISKEDFFEPNMGFAYRFLDRSGILTNYHDHGYYEYFFVVEGSVEHILNGKSDMIYKGDFFMLRPEDAHGYNIPSDSASFELINISVSYEEFDRICNYLGNDCINLIFRNNQHFNKHLSQDRLKRLYDEHEVLNFFRGDTEELVMILRTLLFRVVEMCIKSENKLREDYTFNHLEQCLAKMNTQQNLKQGIKALVDISGFSHGHLCRLMSEYYNTSPVAYITDIRMLYAANLLSNSDMDIKMIADRVGYNSPSHFIKAFKEKYQITPYQYRKIQGSGTNGVS